MKQFGEDSIMGPVIQLDETTPQLQIVMNNKSIDKKTGKVYVSSKRKFNFAGLTKQQVRVKSKELQNKFYNEVAKKYGIESPSEELGDRGKVSLAKYKLEQKQEEIEDKEVILKEKENDVKIFEAFASNNKDAKAVGLKMVKALEKYNPKLAKAAKAALVKKTKEIIKEK